MENSNTDENYRPVSAKEELNFVRKAKLYLFEEGKKYLKKIKQ